MNGLARIVSQHLRCGFKEADAAAAAIAQAFVRFREAQASGPKPDPARRKAKADLTTLIRSVELLWDRAVTAEDADLHALAIAIGELRQAALAIHVPPPRIGRRINAVADQLWPLLVHLWRVHRGPPADAETGPFIEFVDTIHTALKLPEVSPSTLRLAIRRERKSFAARAAALLDLEARYRPLRHKSGERTS